MHIFGLPARYPLACDRTYTPPEAPLEGLLALQERLGLARVVIVQPSVYGTDNSCTLDALRRLGARARGVAVIDSRTLPDELEGMNRAGIRGVRINLQRAAATPAWIEKAAARVAPLGWHVEVFTRISVLRHLAPLPVPLVVDHFGLPASREDVRYLAALLREGNTYVKLSGSHRLAVDPGQGAAFRRG